MVGTESVEEAIGKFGWSCKASPFLYRSFSGMDNVRTMVVIV